MRCKHVIIRNSHCLQCGELMFETESKPCSECSHFVKKENDWPYCGRHLITVTSDMHATYKVENGTCFE